MDDYAIIKKSKLKFKGDKRKKSKSKDKAKSTTQDELLVKDSDFEDREDHGGWWRVTSFDQIKDEVALEFLPGCYARAISNGTIILGNPHPPGEGPDEEEIFTVLRTGSNQIAFKTGFGRYIRADSKKRLMGLSEAVGQPESFLPVFEDGKLAICAYNDQFIAPAEEGETKQIYAKSEKAGPYEMVKIRVNYI